MVPPYNKNVSTNVGRKFLRLIQKHFNSGHLKQLFNKNNMKMSYSCTQNIASIIKSHNTKISTTLATETEACNCRIKREYPLDGNCQTPSVIYKCQVTAPDLPTKVYIGLTEKSFKTRFNSHMQSMSCLLYTSPSPRDGLLSRMPSSA